MSKFDVEKKIPCSKKNSTVEFFCRIFGVKNWQKNSIVEFFFREWNFFRAWNFDMNAPNIPKTRAENAQGIEHLRAEITQGIEPLRSIFSHVLFRNSLSFWEAFFPSKQCDRISWFSFLTKLKSRKNSRNSTLKEQYFLETSQVKNAKSVRLGLPGGGFLICCWESKSENN